MAFIPAAQQLLSSCVLMLENRSAVQPGLLAWHYKSESKCLDLYPDIYISTSVPDVSHHTSSTHPTCSWPIMDSPHGKSFPRTSNCRGTEITEGTFSINVQEFGEQTGRLTTRLSVCLRVWQGALCNREKADLHLIFRRNLVYISISSKSFQWCKTTYPRNLGQHRLNKRGFL